MNNKAFGKRLKTIRNERKLTADKLSEMIDVNPVFIRQIEGGTKLPSLQTLVDLCCALQVSPNYLLTNDLEIEESNLINKLIVSLQSLTPKQIAIVCLTAQTLIENLQ